MLLVFGSSYLAYGKEKLKSKFYAGNLLKIKLLILECVKHLEL